MWSVGALFSSALSTPAPQQTARTRARAFPPRGMLSGTHKPLLYSAFMLLAFQFWSHHGFYHVFILGGFVGKLLLWQQLKTEIEQLFAVEHIHQGERFQIPFCHKNDHMEELGHTLGFSCGVSFFFPLCQTWASANIFITAMERTLLCCLFLFFLISHMLCPTSVRPLGPVNTCSSSTSSWKLFASKWTSQLA